MYLYVEVLRDEYPEHSRANHVHIFVALSALTHSYQMTASHWLKDIHGWYKPCALDSHADV